MFDIQDIQKLINGDRSAFERFNARYGKLVFNKTLRILKNKQDADDCYQNFLLMLPKALLSYNILEYEKEIDFKRWLSRTTYTSACKCYNKRERVHSAELIASGYEHESIKVPRIEEVISDEPNPEEIYVMEEHIKELIEVINSFNNNDDDVSAFLLKNGPGEFSFEEIADILPTTSKGYPRVRVGRGREKLKSRIGEMFPDLFKRYA